MSSPLIDPKGLSARLGDAAWLVVDCRYDLRDVEAGRRAYLEAHIPGALFADIKRDLSGPPLTDRGRHPLPTPEALAKLFGRIGIGAGTTVVAYDDAGGGFAARLWWLLRYLGHDAVLVLDGGWQAWLAAGLPSRGGEEVRSPAVFRGSPRRDWLVRLEDVPSARLLVDSREPPRYRGEVEPLDPVAGHIPGAVNRYWKDNLDGEGRFRLPRELSAEFDRLAGGVPPGEIVFYCGSGVTSCHNLLAMAQAGLPPGRLYAGSWSEWCSDPGRPVARGEETRESPPRG
jgi:thiosulfate/3-mercaptopyruvate sulfurtransferase